MLHKSVLHITKAVKRLATVAFALYWPSTVEQSDATILLDGVAKFDSRPPGA